MKNRKPVEEFSFRESLMTLFDYDESLLDPEVILYRMKEKVDIGSFLKKIDSVLGLAPNSITLDDGIRVSGEWGDFMPLESLGDGFQTTLSWITDMFGWMLMHLPESFDHNNISGIVIIDELEQHLHPSWQREIIKYLSEQFPHIQFLASSHSPMCALGLTALEEKETRLIRLSQTDEAVEAYISESPENKRADQVLTSPLFGLF